MNASEILTFIRAGRAVFTLQSAATGTYFTYRVARAGGSRVQYLASVLVAPDVYCYFGMISAGRLVATGGSKVPRSAPSSVALAWFLRQLERGELPASVVFRHEGRCGRCARALTTPASLDTGLGPDCAEALDVLHEAQRGPARCGRTADCRCWACESGRDCDRMHLGGTGFSAGRD
jgi:hypothetical protein